MTIIVTGCAGFIGSHLCNRLLNENYKVIGIDNINDYYDTELKNNRLNMIKSNNFIFEKCDIKDDKDLDKIFKKYKPEIVANLAGLAGVRYSIENPEIYILNNINGFHNILKECKDYNVKHLIYASSSSVYGDNFDVPFKEDTSTDKPVSIYAATKKCDEVLAYAYSTNYNLKTTGLRFFTVYGPYGRPDMAYYSFTNKVVNNEKITLYNNGDMKRDFTYIDDLIESIIRIIKGNNSNNYNIYNIGSSNPYNLLDFVNILFEEIKKEGLISKDSDINSYIEFGKMQNGDVHETYSDNNKFYKDYNYRPNTDLKDGLNKFVKWYKEYYKIK